MGEIIVFQQVVLTQLDIFVEDWRWIPISHHTQNINQKGTIY